MRRGMVLMLLIGIACAGGCGGSDAEGGTALSKAEFRKEATDICSRAGNEYRVRAQRASERHRGEQLDAQEQAELASDEVIMPVFTRLVHGLSELGIPAEESETFEVFVSSYEKALEQAEEDITALSGGRALVPVREAAKMAGVSACANL